MAENYTSVRKEARFTWDDRADKTLRVCFTNGMSLKMIAYRLGTNATNVRERALALGLKRTSEGQAWRA